MAENVISSRTEKRFKRKLDKFWKNQRNFNYKAPLMFTATHDHNIELVMATELKSQA